MKTKAAVCYQPNTPLVVEELELDPPKAGEVLVRSPPPASAAPTTTS